MVVNLMMKNKILFVSCSEYTEHIQLTLEEARFAIEMIDKFEISSKEHLLEHFGISMTPLDPSSLSGGGTGTGFIETDIVNNYDKLRDIIKRYRKKKYSKKELLNAAEILFGGNNDIYEKEG
jgi:hypothetical protein